MTDELKRPLECADLSYVPGIFTWIGRRMWWSNLVLHRRYVASDREECRGTERGSQSLALVMMRGRARTKRIGNILARSLGI
jgi:hypothetical protein